MGTAERRVRIMRLLCRRRHETVANLAYEFGVSERTIRRDIAELSLTEPIYTQSGKYGGGVYVLDGYTVDRMYMVEEQLSVLKKLSEQAQNEDVCSLSEKEMDILRSMIAQYTKPWVQKDG